MDPKRVESVYAELGQMLIELDPDPVSKGPGYLQELISRTRGYLNRTSVLTQEAHQEHQLLDRELNAKKTVFQLRSDELLAEDQRVRQLPSIDDRMASINLLLRDERQDIARLEQEIREIGFVEKAIRHRHKELDNTISAIRMQKSLIDSEARTGSFYGDEGDKSRGDIYSSKKRAVDEDLDGDEIGRLLAESIESPKEVEGTPIPSGPNEESTQQLPLSNTEIPVTNDNEFEKFLNDDGLDDIFAGLDV